tara:strand:+ start:16934 stop:17983 length:1050 start_codon:yes stop_codon:yes gene_type:complete
MIKRTRVEMPKVIIHKVANKFNSGHNAFSDETIKFDEESYDAMKNFLMKPFTGLTQSYRFTHPAGSRLNEMNNIVSDLFASEEYFVENSQAIVEHLYSQSNSAQIKTGDVLVVFFEGIEYQDVLTDAVGVFKIENKASFFQTYQENENFDVALVKGISTNKIDKGCLILNTQDTEGAIVLSVDNNNYDAQYWINNFLGVQLADDYNAHTKNYLELCKEFADEVIAPQMGINKKAAFLSETVDYFKENESIKVDDFKKEVFANDVSAGLFDDYKKHYENLNELFIRNSFDVSGAVLKKEKAKLKTEIKLDTNINIKLDVDAPDAASEYLERGYDDEKKMKFYKVYFNEEK